MWGLEKIFPLGDHFVRIAACDSVSPRRTPDKINLITIKSGDNGTFESLSKCVGTGYLGKGFQLRNSRKEVVLGALAGDKEAVAVYPICRYTPNRAGSGQANDRQRCSGSQNF